LPPARLAGRAPRIRVLGSLLIARQGPRFFARAGAAASAAARLRRTRSRRRRCRAPGRRGA